jgi:hypothetical protein
MVDESNVESPNRLDRGVEVRGRKNVSSVA